MTDRLNIVSPRNYTTRDGEVKTAFTKIGVAFATKSGWALTFEALPLPSINDKGVIETKVLLMPPREDDGGSKSRNADHRGAVGPDDDIPFTPSF
jgi:hypothetical protein